MKKGKAMLMILLMVAVAMPVKAKEMGVLSLHGVGKMTLEANAVTMSFGVETRGTNLEKANEENKKIAGSIRSMLLENGINESDIHMGNFSIYPSDGEFVIRYSLTATTKQLDKVSGFIRKAIEKGANDQFYLNYYHDQEASFADQILQQAIENATSEAKKIATYSQVEIQGIKSIDLTNQLARAGGYRSYDANMAQQDFRFEPDPLQLNQQVRMEFYFVNP